MDVSVRFFVRTGKHLSGTQIPSHPPYYALRENRVVEIEAESTATDREWKLLGGPARVFLCPG